MVTTAAAPLIIRSAPNGRIIGRVTNGRNVSAERYRTDSTGRRWARIAYAEGNRIVEGWVLARYLSC